MQKFSFYLVRFEIYRQKTKYGPILGLFSKSYNRGLRLIGWTYRIAIFRVDKASEVITFEQKKFAKFGHQVALRQFLLFQFLPVLTMFRGYVLSFPWEKWKKWMSFTKMRFTTIRAMTLIFFLIFLAVFYGGCSSQLEKPPQTGPEHGQTGQKLK